jgi:hypothetical protein
MPSYLFIGKHKAKTCKGHFMPLTHQSIKGTAYFIDKAPELGHCWLRERAASLPHGCSYWEKNIIFIPTNFRSKWHPIPYVVHNFWTWPYSVRTEISQLFSEGPLCRRTHLCTWHLSMSQYGPLRYPDTLASAYMFLLTNCVCLRCVSQTCVQIRFRVFKNNFQDISK